MARDSDYLVGIDLGTKKITVVVAEVVSTDPVETQIICIGEAPSRGLRKGMIVNLEQAVTSVSDAIADAESMLVGVKISSAAVAFSGQTVECQVLHGMISLGRSARTITPDDLEQVVETALSSTELPPSSCFIHTLPNKYAIDGNGGIENPLDMTGTRLEVELTAISIPTTIAQNVVNCVEKAGVKVSALILKPVAEALGTLNSDERAIGASVVSIGAGTTAVAVFADGHLVHAAEIPVGGDHITNDISVVEKIPFAFAEEQKKTINVDPEVRTKGKITLDNRGRQIELDKEEMAEIVESRFDELFSEGIVTILDQLREVGLQSDVLLTGGVMLTPGVVKFAESHLKNPVRIGLPVRREQMPRERSDCRYNSAAGIIVYLTEKRKNFFAYVEAPLSLFKSASAGKPSSKVIKGTKRPSQSLFKTVTRNVRDLFKELF